MKWLFGALLLVSIIGCTEELSTSKQDRACEPEAREPWMGIAPRWYEISDQRVHARVNSEAFHRTDGGHEAFVARAKEVVMQWGQDADKVKIDGVAYRYEPSVFVSEHFVRVVFFPMSGASDGFPVVHGCEITVTLEENDGNVVSIEVGS
jgi:hypothetical protein